MKKQGRPLSKCKTKALKTVDVYQATHPVSAVDDCVKFCVESLCVTPNPGGASP